LEKAFDHFQVAAKAGNTNSQCSLAMCFIYGKGVEIDMGAALYWLKESADLGNQYAIDYLSKHCSKIEI
jgi:TPR repeat protein